MLGSECQLNDNSIIQNLEAILGEDDITTTDFQNLEAILDENDIAIPDFDDLKAILNENDIIQASHDLSATPGDDNAISPITEALDNAKGISEIASQSSISFTSNKSIQTQDEESQNSTAKFDLRKRLEEASLFTCRQCSAKIKTILGYDVVNLLPAIEKENKRLNENSMYSAIRNKDLKAIEVLLNSGININERYSNGVTSLHIAIRYNHLDTIRTLLKFNPDLELRNHYNNTPLHTAIGKFNAKVIELLLAHGADPNTLGNKGNTVLHKIINSNNDRAISCLQRFLANKKTNLNIKNNRGESFINAVLNRFKILNQNGKKFFYQHLRSIAEHYYRLNDESRLIVRSDSEFNAIIERYRNEALQIYRYIFNGIESCSDELKMAQVLQSHRFKINNKDLDGNTLLHRAIADLFDLKKIKMLLDINIDVDSQNNRGNTALHIVASSDKKLAITKVLLSYGANVNLQNVSKQTPLHIAAARSSTSILEVLLNCSNIDPNKQDMLGNTALHNALKSKMLFHTAELLLKNDTVSLNIKNKEGQCFTSIILNKFKEQNNEYLVKLLAKRYDRLSDESKLIIKGDSKFYAVVEEYRKRFIPYNVLSQPSSSSFVNEFLNIAK